MRLHRLEVDAFGPFGSRQVVDFDRLTETGLFLLHGPTGAGKTSVLDAVSFALYGKVPGVRGHGARLRSDHAAAGAVPRVLCELTVGGRRFEVTRDAEWLRPKRRGTGLIREQSRVALRELVGGEWRAVSNRIDETAELLNRVIGLGPDQFTKLVLLPQGEFATFLRAKPDDRKPLLQKLFGTERFEAVEAWLVARRRELRLEGEAARSRTAQLHSRAQQASADITDRSPGAEAPADDEQALAEVTGWLATARSAAAEAYAEVRLAEPADEAARETLAEARRTARLQSRREALLRQDSALAGAAAEQLARRARLDLARAAEVVAPLATGLADAEQRRADAGRALAAATESVAGLGEVLTGTSPDEKTALLHAEAGQLAELSKVAAEVAELDDRIRARAEVAAQARTSAAEQSTAAAALTGQRNRLAADRATAALAATRLPDRERDLERASQVARAVLDRDRLARTLSARESAVSEAFEQYRAAAESALELRARRLDGMAAELARHLTDGDPCPVCGAEDHPAPAEPAGDHVTESDEASGAEGRDAAERRLRAAEDERARVTTELAEITVTAGELDAATAAGSLAEADRRRAEARQAGEQVARIDRDLRRVDEALERSARELGLARSAVQAADDEVTALVGSRTALDQQLGSLTAAQVRARVERLGVRIAAWQRLAEATRDDRTTADRCSQLRTTATAAARKAGFDDLAAASAALLEPAGVARLRAEIDSYESDHASVRAALADPELVAAGDRPAPDVPAAELLAEQAQQRRRRASETHLISTRAVAALAGLTDRLSSHLAATRPLRERFSIVESLSRSVEGGGDNQLRMRLSAYVLAARLEQVAEAASHRLAAMTDGRYTLRHSDGPTRGGARSGLGLLVLDAWTGVERDPATLSGGETFCTSLALALGLADVVSAEAGGMQLETLLVDEGFGSLDDETLELVLDVVDGLRSGGRAVGLVSHVSDLRQRIPAQLEVVKTRSGSSLRQHAAG